MEKDDARRGKVTDEHRQEAAKLKALWEDAKARLKAAGYGSQEAFGQEFNIGNQAAVGFFLNGKTALSLKAATGFARGLHCQIEDFSPRLAEQLRQAQQANSGGALATPPLTPSDEAQELAFYFDQLSPDRRAKALPSLVALVAQMMPDGLPDHETPQAAPREVRILLPQMRGVKAPVSPATEPEQKTSATAPSSKAQ
jgi:hypothetical protein